MTDLIIRSLRGDEAHLLLSMPDVGYAKVEPLASRYPARAAAGEYRPEWTWIAVRGETVVARAIWWGGPADTAPSTLDRLDFDHIEDGVALLSAVPLRTDYLLQLPPHWRTLPPVRDAVERRIEAATQAGLRPFVERLHYIWTSADGLPERSSRLEFRPEPDDEVILNVLRRIMEGTLDAHERRAIARGGVNAAADEEMAFFRWCPSPRDWWRLGYTADGQLAGIAVPARNNRDDIIAYIGVVPEQRGHGYAYDLLVEATHLLVEAGTTAIVADTDVTNTPMAAVFAKAGYPVNQERLFLAPDPTWTP